MSSTLQFLHTKKKHEKKTRTNIFWYKKKKKNQFLKDTIFKDVQHKKTIYINLNGGLLFILADDEAFGV